MKRIAAEFETPGDFIDGELCKSGHINDTYFARFSKGGPETRIILQRINHEVFKKPAEVQENIVRVTEHIRRKLTDSGAQDLERRVLQVIPTLEGYPFIQDDSGNFWRAYHFVEGGRTFDTAESESQAYKAAAAFGEFQRQLVDLPGPPLNYGIPDFHNAPLRYLHFTEALEKDQVNRAADAKKEIDFLIDNAPIFDILPEQETSGRIPVRITHNDTKINNVIFDEQTGEALAVIDLDTIMPGLVHYDFGDLVRTCISPAKEDEQDLDKVFLEMPRFKALTEGYLSTAGDFLNAVEREHLVTSGQLMTLLIGMRFLTDHLAGDKYFSIHRENHNLDRCHVQFRLVKLMQDNEKTMQKIVENAEC